MFFSNPPVFITVIYNLVLAQGKGFIKSHSQMPDDIPLGSSRRKERGRRKEEKDEEGVEGKRDLI